MLCYKDITKNSNEQHETNNFAFFLPFVVNLCIELESMWGFIMKKFLKGFAITILILVGLILVFNRQIMNYVVNQTTQTHVERITKTNIKKGNDAKGNFDFSKVKSIGPVQIGKGVNGDVPVIGELIVPSVDIDLPISKGVSNAVLTAGAGTMKPDQKMGEGNYALAGHYMTNSGVLFSPLENTKLGQKIYITDLKHIYTYKIDYKEVIAPTKVSIIDDAEGKKQITLITCADGGVNRWAIKGELVSVTDATKEKIKDSKKDVVKHQESNKQKSTNYLLIIGVILLLIVLLIYVRSRRKSLKK